MIYPVKRWVRWYIADDFGTKRKNYYHNGLDINLRTGGNTDLGEDLLAVADGEIVYYHNNSHPNSNYGRHMVLKCETAKGTRWYHYAHCQKMYTNKKTVKQGDVIGKLGKSGTTLAHLHFSVFKVDPKTLYKGIDSIAKTKTELNKYWERFELLEVKKGVKMPKKHDCQEKRYREERDACSAERETLHKSISAYKGKVTEKEKVIADLELKLAEKQKDPVDEALRETGRQVISWAVGITVAYVFTRFPQLSEMGLEQAGLITAITALGIRHLDKLLHIKGKNESNDLLVGGIFRF